MPQSTTAQGLRSPPSYDQQASHYDQRVGLSDIDCQQIAATVSSLAQLQPHQLLVEVGAGTGQIGYWFTQTPGKYLGFDLSAGMLAQFRKRLEPSQYQWQLLQADGNQPWPVADGAARVIFSSRAIHLLHVDHVCRECHRLSAPGGTLVIFGRVQRPQDSLQAQMKRRMQQLLKERGLQGRQGERRQRQLLDILTEQGGEPIEAITVSRWGVPHRPEKSLKSWWQKAGLAGNNLPETVKAEILADLEAWAIDQFGSLQASVESEEAYVLQGILLKAEPNDHTDDTEESP